jgi:hypothetical protein
MAISRFWNSIRVGALGLETGVGDTASVVPQVEASPSVPLSHGSDINTTYFHVRDPKASGESPRTAWIDTPGDRAAGSGLRAIVRNVEIGFGYGASEIEEYAEKEARAQGDKSLPSIDIPAEKELEAETVIRERSKKVFSDWLRSLRERIGDAILAACNVAGEKMELLKNAVHELEQTRARVAPLEAPSRSLNGAEESFPHTRYERLINHWFYLVVIGMLVGVDWVANVPVFRELLPQDTGTEDFWRHILQQSEKFGSWAGLYRVWERVIFSPDVSFLALGVIVILVFSGHLCGFSLRRLIALRSKDNPSVNEELHPHRQQMWIAFVCSCVAMILCLSFLFISRSELQASATERRDAATAEVQMYAKQLTQAKAARDDDASVDSQVKLGDAKKRLDQRSKDFEYATRISIMNFPMLLLNAALVLCAVVGAYLVSSGKVSQWADSEPTALGRKSELTRLHEEAKRQREEVRRLVAAVQVALAEADFLSRAKPFLGWEAKAARLESIIPLFRSTNATHRGVNVQQVKGFRPLVKFDLPAVVEDQTIRPEGLNDRYCALECEFQSIRKHIEFLHLVSLNGGMNANPNGSAEANQSGNAVTILKGSAA